jgi:hypothetical protein
MFPRVQHELLATAGRLVGADLNATVTSKMHIYMPANTVSLFISSVHCASSENYSPSVVAKTWNKLHGTSCKFSFGFGVCAQPD